MSEVGTYEILDDIGIITIDSPPVNALGHKARRALHEGFTRLSADARVKAIVLMCAGRTFFAGADISELGKPPLAPSLKEVFPLIENGGKPVIAAIHGTALGGGYELALICHYRIAVPSAKVGLPEVKLGLLPGAGGTQRLPRLVGVEAALEIITGGAPISAPRAIEYGMIDELAEEGHLRRDAIAFATRILAEGKPARRVRDRQEKVEPARGHPEIYEAFLQKNAKAFRGFQAPVNIVKSIEAAAELPFGEGMKRERELFEELVSGTQSAAQRYYFFAERQTRKIPDLPADTPVLPVNAAGVIGAGTMGGGIAMSLADAGIPVTLVEASHEALERGLAVIRGHYEGAAAKGRMTSDEAERRIGLIRPSSALEDLADVDLVIEAVFEDMQVKRDIFAKLDGIAKKGAILASNTSFLDLDEIAAVTARPESVVGLHFFSPANVMRLLEIVRGAKTGHDVLATVLALAPRIAKVPVVAGVCHGFIANRVMTQRSAQADRLVLQGPTPQEIDSAIYDFGFAMGPFRMKDLVGLDVLRTGDERTLYSDLVALGRLGQKRGGGFYDYDGNRNATPSPVAARVIEEFAAYKGVDRCGPMAPDDIIARLLYPVVNEAARVLEEGIALRASDIDVACILGYNWPLFTGGPMFWADTVGLDRIVAGLEAMGIAPAAPLAAKAKAGERFT